MRFVFGPIPKSETFDPMEAGWNRLVSSTDVAWTNVIVPVGMISCIAAGCVCLRWAARTPEMDPWTLIAVLVTPAFFIPIHELLHCVGYRVPLRSRRLVTGIWLERGVWYVVYDAPLPRNRVLWMLIAPLLGLSVVPLLAVLTFSPSGYSRAGGYLVLMHAAMCVGDVISFLRILWNIPATAEVHNSGWTTCWRDSGGASGG